MDVKLIPGDKRRRAFTAGMFDSVIYLVDTQTGAYRPVFDPSTITDTATYEDPKRFPAGIRAVYVNGTRVADNGAHTGARPGRTIRRNKS
jgi:N-acyl-D-aspartate/D-glutamate deacylase